MFLVLIPTLGCFMPVTAELVIVGQVIGLKIVIGVIPIIDGVSAGVQVARSLGKCVSEAGIQGKLGVFCPGSYVITW